ncbi:uncharacterized protein N7515_008198 [Penicillium bovifimosum]|uniref:Inheritance of peroxisomes protein 1 n=1 Tax=Penicillium bovifimosum TaxID=126998 RepID=A0A9W9KXL6_9EURO|nr:uncharacterized protein N7515_008198 [Penicillium bovifimosum]KAJ5124373.1 hypothetical protein N7515_008198 [Penicillium bovifimosum]
MHEPPSEPGQTQSLRRSITLPTKLNPLAQRRASVPNTPEHVIFYHPFAKIVHFSPRALAPIPSSTTPSDFDYPVDTIETLPWRSATERTVATAPLRLEKIHGSTAFLKCGNVVHAILKNSQCWCVDGVSKFVLRIRPLTYYRIELPYETDDDKSLVQDLKIALPTVLRYEVTPCPFMRAFSVELPSDAMAPRRKKAWRPKDRKEGVPGVLEPSRETPSSSPARSPVRSDWVDSPSTGDDTDGNLTDDSCFTSNKANSTILETIPDDGESSPIETSGPSVYHGPPRRSVTEIPQTFTSLLAKFEATPITEDDRLSVPDTKPESVTSTGTAPSDVAPQIDHQSKATTNPLKADLPADDAAKAALEFKAAVDTGFTTEDQPATESAPEPEVLSRQRSDEVAVEVERVLEAEGPQEAASQGERSTAVETDQPIEEIPPQMAQSTAGLSIEVDDYDTSFASSPESFHSAEPQSPDSVSTHPTSVGGHDLPESMDTFHLWSAKESTPASPRQESEYQKLNVPPFDDIPRTTGEQYPPSMNIPSCNSSPNRAPDAFSDTSPSMIRTSKEPPPSFSISAPSAVKMHHQASAKPPTSNPDFNHMTTEFRRRAKATREREVSPMPPASALYQPPGDDASSFISKAITLVLIPPAYLFIILLHIAARVAVNPNSQPTITSTPRKSDSRSQHSKKPSVAVDDFSFPLEPQSSSEYEDAQACRKLDPWDLD